MSVISSCPYSLGVKVKLIGYDATSKEVCRYQLSNQPRFSSSKLSTNRISEMVDINIPTIERWEVLWETFDVVDNQPNTMPPEWVKKNVSVTVEPIKTSGKHTLKDGITVPLVLENRSDQSLDVYIKLIAVDKKNSIIYSKKGSMIRIEPYKTCKFDLGVAEKEDGLITASWRVELEVKTVVDTVERKYKTQQKRAG